MKHVVHLVLACVCTAAIGERMYAEQPPQNISLEKIIEKVEQNERLYDNIDVTIQTIYDDPSLDNTPPVQSSPSTGMMSLACRHQNYSTHYVRQNGMFRSETTGKRAMVDGTIMDEGQWRVSDNHMTVSYDASSNSGDIFVGGVEDDKSVHPHMLLIKIGEVMAEPLSTLLKGHRAMAAYPNSRWNAQETLENTYEGEAEVQGLKCHKVWVTSLVNGIRQWRFELWLAETRNYIPIQYSSYRLSSSEMIPACIGDVSEWREVNPGVWFPTAAQCTRYNDFRIRDKGEVVPTWTEEYTASKMSLEPKYDQSYFRKLKFPDGATICEMKNGKVVRSFRQGATPKPTSPTNDHP